jgi:hypothetical protein
MAQRQALRLRTMQTVDRLAPVRLAEDASDFASDMLHETGQQIRRHPFTAIGVVAVAGIALFNRPLSRLVDHWLDQIDPPAVNAPPLVDDEDTRAVSDG